MSMDIDDLWLRDGDERFAGFLRRLGFDHNEAATLAEKTRPPWRGWDRRVPRRLLPKNDVRRQVTDLVAMKDGSGYVEAPRRPERKCICLNVTGHSIYCPANPNGRMPYPSTDPVLNIPPMPVAGYLRETAEPLPLPPGPAYDGKPMILEDEREVTEMHEPGYRA